MVEEDDDEQKKYAAFLGDVGSILKEQLGGLHSALHSRAPLLMLFIFAFRNIGFVFKHFSILWNSEKHMPKIKERVLNDKALRDSLVDKAIGSPENQKLISTLPKALQTAVQNSVLSGPISRLLAANGIDPTSSESTKLEELMQAALDNPGKIKSILDKFVEFDKTDDLIIENAQKFNGPEFNAFRDGFDKIRKGLQAEYKDAPKSAIDKLFNDELEKVLNACLAYNSNPDLKKYTKAYLMEKLHLDEKSFSQFMNVFDAQDIDKTLFDQFTKKALILADSVTELAAEPKFAKTFEEVAKDTKGAKARLTNFLEVQIKKGLTVPDSDVPIKQMTTSQRDKLSHSLSIVISEALLKPQELRSITQTITSEGLDNISKAAKPAAILLSSIAKNPTAKTQLVLLPSQLTPLAVFSPITQATLKVWGKTDKDMAAAALAAGPVLASALDTPEQLTSLAESIADNTVEVGQAFDILIEVSKQKEARGALIKELVPQAVSLGATILGDKQSTEEERYEVVSAETLETITPVIQEIVGHAISDEGELIKLKVAVQQFQTANVARANMERISPSARFKDLLKSKLNSPTSLDSSLELCGTIFDLRKTIESLSRQEQTSEIELSLQANKSLIAAKEEELSTLLKETDRKKSAEQAIDMLEAYTNDVSSDIEYSQAIELLAQTILDISSKDTGVKEAVRKNQKQISTATAEAINNNLVLQSKLKEFGIEGYQEMVEAFTPIVVELAPLALDHPTELSRIITALPKFLVDMPYMNRNELVSGVKDLTDNIFSILKTNPKMKRLFENKLGGFLRAHRVELGGFIEQVLSRGDKEVFMQMAYAGMNGQKIVTLLEDNLSVERLERIINIIAKPRGVALEDTRMLMDVVEVLKVSKADLVKSAAKGNLFPKKGTMGEGITNALKSITSKDVDIADFLRKKAANPSKLYKGTKDADLKDRYLTARLRSGFLTDIKIKGTKSSPIRLGGRVCSNLAFDESTLEHVDLSSSKIVGVAFTKSTIKNSTFMGTTFVDCDFSKTKIRDCDFSGAKMDKSSHKSFMAAVKKLGKKVNVSNIEIIPPAKVQAKKPVVGKHTKRVAQAGSSPVRGRLFI